MKLYSYVVREDTGFAPNPHGGYCTLATCKPIIRRTCQEGDWVMGTGSVSSVGSENLVYLMKVTEVLSLEAYNEDLRFRVKRPSFSREPWRRRGDNIYFKGAQGQWQQRRSFHISKDMGRDLSGLNVLISDHFYYFGAEAPRLPGRLLDLRKRGPGHRIIRDRERIDRLVEWVSAGWQIGVIGEPFLSNYLPQNDRGCSIKTPSPSKSLCGGREKP